MQRALNGCRSQRQNVYLGPHFLEPLFVGDAKVLFLVDNQKAKVLELDALGQQRMGAHTDVDAAFLKPLAGVGGILCGNKARQGPDFHRKSAKALGKAAIVLAGKKRRRADDRDLHPRHRRHKGRAHRDLGLAEADIADNQPVHRAPGLKIGHDIGNGVQLIVSFLIGKARSKGLPCGMGRIEDRRVAQVTLGRNPHQSVGDFADAFLELGLLGLPCTTAQTVKQPLLMAITAKKLYVFNGKIELGILGIDQMHIFMRGSGAVARGFGHAQGFQPHKAADPMFDMHHQIARCQRAKVLQEVLGLALAARLADQPVPQNILLGNDGYARRCKAFLKRPDRQEELPLAFRHLARVADLACAGQALILKQAFQPLARTIRP